ncbi:hypothetical protein A2U01_0069243, partial [Trifolium medium]|nr:hypothetical protein [Trifolium medium]
MKQQEYIHAPAPGAAQAWRRHQATTTNPARVLRLAQQHLRLAQ